MNHNHRHPFPRFAPTAITLATLSLIGAAQAQSAPGESSNTVVVSGLRASLESALNKKREDNGIVDVIKAEDIAKFPDTNLAESLQRVPGVSIDRDGALAARGNVNAAATEKLGR